RFVEMERLRVELGGEGLDLCGVDGDGSRPECLTHREVIQIAICSHDSCLLTVKRPRLRTWMSCFRVGSPRSIRWDDRWRTTLAKKGNGVARESWICTRRDSVRPNRGFTSRGDPFRARGFPDARCRANALARRPAS